MSGDACHYSSRMSIPLGGKRCLIYLTTVTFCRANLIPNCTHKYDSLWLIGGFLGGWLISCSFDFFIWQTHTFLWDRTNQTNQTGLLRRDLLTPDVWSDMWLEIQWGGFKGPPALDLAMIQWVDQVMVWSMWETPHAVAAGASEQRAWLCKIPLDLHVVLWYITR